MPTAKHKRQYPFGKHSAVNMAYSRVNQQWFVWRDDAGHQALLARYDLEQNALEDFSRRVAFIQQMEAIV